MKFMSVLPVVAVALLFAASPAPAQDVQRIAAIVNDDVISARDLERRIDFILSATGQPNNADNRRRIRDRALRGLIDERLQSQEAGRRNIRVADEEVEVRIAGLARQNNIPPERFEEFLRGAGVAKETLESQLRADIGWTKLVRARLVPTIAISDEEVNAAVQRIRDSVGQTEDSVSEIFLAVDNPDQEEEVRRTAQRLVEQIRGGAPFPAIARQFSQGTTAAAGGEVGWVQPGTLTEEVEASLRQLKRGEVSDPVRTVSGYYIVRLNDQRRIALADPADASVTLKQIMLPLPAGDGPERRNQLELAQQVSATLGGCNDVEAMAKELQSSDSGSLGTLRVGDLPPAFRNAVATLAAGKVSAPVATDTAVHVFVVCDRNDPKEAGIDPEQIRAGMMQRRAEMLARRYLRDLRRDAVVELR
jgi:peptidyl-prolyl cis-trans isomerase SurA